MRRDRKRNKKVENESKQRCTVSEKLEASRLFSQRERGGSHHYLQHSLLLSSLVSANCCMRVVVPAADAALRQLQCEKTARTRFVEKARELRFASLSTFFVLLLFSITPDACAHARKRSANVFGGDYTAYHNSGGGRSSLKNVMRKTQHIASEKKSRKRCREGGL
jgi:hypothetical protein